jgi:hypothetical protein
MNANLLIAIFAVSLAGPALAAEDVKVVNNADHPVPVEVQGTLAVRNADDAARNAFQIGVTLSQAAPYLTTTIPAGHRFVIDFVTLSGDATSLSGPIQPIVLLYATINGATVNYYFPMASSTVPGQFYSATGTKIYADQLAVGMGFSGYTPASIGMNVAISGHLVSVP